MTKFKAYFLNKEYHDFLKSNIREFLFKDDRPYIGFISIKVANQNYAIPLWSDKSNAYRTNHKYSFFIPNENNEKLGILRIDKMIPVQDNENFIKEISINDLPYNESIRLIKELEYINQPKIAEKINLLAHEARMMKDDKLKFNIDFELAEKYCLEWSQINSKDNNTNSQRENIYKRYASYFDSKESFNELFKEFKENCDFLDVNDSSNCESLKWFSDEFLETYNKEHSSKEYYWKWMKKNANSIINDATDLYIQFNKILNEFDENESNTFDFICERTKVDWGNEFSTIDELKEQLESNYFIREIMYQHFYAQANDYFSNANEIFLDNPKLAEDWKQFEISSNFKLSISDLDSFLKSKKRENNESMEIK